MRTTRFLIAILLSTFLLQACNQPAEVASAAAETPSLWTVEKKREWASQLRADGLDEQALVIYEDLLREGRGLSEKAMVGTSIVVADIHIQKARYEQALAALYRARLFGAEGESLRKIDEKRILCFERLGRSAAADRLLDKASALTGKDAVDAGGDEVLAVIGEERVTRSDLDAMLAASPPEMKAKAEEAAVRLELLKGLVARRVLERKALKLKLDEDPKVRLAVEEAGREILVRKLLAEEVKDEVEVSDDDVRLYFEAHRNRFREPDQIGVAVIQVADADDEKKVRAELVGRPFEEVARQYSNDPETAPKGGLIQDVVIEGRSHPAFPQTAALFELLDGVAEGEVASEALPVTGGRRVVKLIQRKSGQRFEFEQVKEDAGRMLRAERERAAIDALLKKALESADVTIHEDRL